MMSILTFREL